MTKKREEQDFSCGKCLLMQGGACAKGCMAMAENQTGDPYGDDGECEMRRVLFLNGIVKEENDP